MTGALRRPAAWAALALVLATTARPPTASAADGKPLELTLAFTGDVSGYLEPCG